MREVHHIANIWPSMQSDEFQVLKDDIATNGQVEPVTTWRGKIVDGKHRAKACRELNIELKCNPLPNDWDEPRVLMHCASLHKRRNLTADQRAVVGANVAERYRELTKERQVQAAKATNEKLGRGEPERLPLTGGKRETEEKPNTTSGPPKRAPTASSLAAKEVGSSARQVERAIALRREAPELAERVASGEMKLKQAERVAKAPKEVREAMAAQLETSTRTDAEGDSWGTPTQWLDIARKVMGAIDLDPATNKGAQQIVKAAEFYTITDDGLSKRWNGRVWMNPPYSQPWVTKFCEKLVSHYEAGEVEQACVLVNNATDTKFGQLLLTHCSAVLFTSGRVSFCLPGTEVEVQGTRQGQMLVYFGENVAAFREACDGLGWVGVTAL